MISTCAGGATTTTCVSSSAGSGLLSPQTSDAASAASAASVTPLRSRSRLSTRLSSVPEDESVTQRRAAAAAAFADKSVDLEPEDSIASVEFEPTDSQLLTVRRTSGNERTRYLELELAS